MSAAPISTTMGIFSWSIVQAPWIEFTQPVRLILADSRDGIAG